MNKKAFSGQLQQVWQSARRLRVLLFLVLLVALYGFIGWRINSFTNITPSEAAVTLKAPATSQPYIDPALVEKIKQLEDTNVNVKTLFDKARQNPFRE